MRCHYEVLEIERNVTSEDIKKAYKSLALRWHPDRNPDKVEEATNKFKEISSSYAVLFDIHERKWYDDHRESILRGYDSSSNGSSDSSSSSSSSDRKTCKELYTFNVFPYFTSACYNEFNDDSDGFYAIYREIYNKIIQFENDSIDRENSKKCGYILNAPTFGVTLAHSKDVIKFYDYFMNFTSILTFTWEDKYNPAEADVRQLRRVIDKENKKFRDIAKKAYNDNIRALTAYIKNRDVRMINIQKDISYKKQQTLLNKQRLKDEKKEKRRQWKQQPKDVDEIEQLMKENEQKGAYLLADYSDDELANIKCVNEIVSSDDEKDEIDREKEKQQQLEKGMESVFISVSNTTANAIDDDNDSNSSNDDDE